MEVKNNIRVILYILLLLLVFSIMFFIIKIEISNEKQNKTNIGMVAEKTMYLC